LTSAASNWPPLEQGWTATSSQPPPKPQQQPGYRSDRTPRLTRLLGECHNDPDLFNSAVLGRDRYTDYQLGWCNDLVDFRAVAIETGNMLGKDYWIGGIVAWWLWTRPNSLVIVTGPGQALLGSVTWKEIRRAINNAGRIDKDGKPHGIPLKARISNGVKASPQVVDLGGGWQALGYSTTTVERASGQHAGELLVIVEEASGVPDEIWDAIESLGYTKLVAIGNPLRADGGFVDLCNQAAADAAAGVPRRQAVCCRNLPSTASPHSTWEKSPVGLADRTWLESVERKYGRESLWFRCHVLAIRPSLTNEQLIPEADLDRCISDETRRTVDETRTKWPAKCGRRRLGCDVGEGCGNSRTVVWVRDDLGILELHASRYTGPRDAAQVMVRLAHKHGVKEEDSSYDGAGQTGKRLGNCLSGLGFGRARAYFGSSGGGKRATNLRTACALALARRLDPHHYCGPGQQWLPFAIPAGADWPAVREELKELRYHLHGDESALELKEDLMDRLGRSPDFADSLCQTFRAEAVEG
jgi:hypothetical protein